MSLISGLVNLEVYCPNITKPPSIPCATLVLLFSADEKICFQSSGLRYSICPSTGHFTCLDTSVSKAHMSLFWSMVLRSVISSSFTMHPICYRLAFYPVLVASLLIGLPQRYHPADQAYLSIGELTDAALHQKGIGSIESSNLPFFSSKARSRSTTATR